MRESRVSSTAVTVITILFLICCANLILGLGLSIIGMFFSLVGGLLKLLFSKEVIMLAGIGLIVYLFTRKRGSARHYDY